MAKNFKRLSTIIVRWLFGLDQKEGEYNSEIGTLVNASGVSFEKTGEIKSRNLAWVIQRMAENQRIMIIPNEQGTESLSINVEEDYRDYLQTQEGTIIFNNNRPDISPLYVREGTDQAVSLSLGTVAPQIRNVAIPKVLTVRALGTFKTVQLNATLGRLLVRAMNLDFYDSYSFIKEPLNPATTGNVNPRGTLNLDELFFQGIKVVPRNSPRRSADLRVRFYMDIYRVPTEPQDDREPITGYSDKTDYGITPSVAPLTSADSMPYGYFSFFLMPNKGIFINIPRVGATEVPDITYLKNILIRTDAFSTPKFLNIIIKASSSSSEALEDAYYQANAENLIIYNYDEDVTTRTDLINRICTAVNTSGIHDDYADRARESARHTHEPPLVASPYGEGLTDERYFIDNTPARGGFGNYNQANPNIISDKYIQKPALTKQIGERGFVLSWGDTSNKYSVNHRNDNKRFPVFKGDEDDSYIDSISIVPERTSFGSFFNRKVTNRPNRASIEDALPTPRAGAESPASYYAHIPYYYTYTEIDRPFPFDDSEDFRIWTLASSGVTQAGLNKREELTQYEQEDIATRVSVNRRYIVKIRQYAHGTEIDTANSTPLTVNIAQGDGLVPSFIYVPEQDIQTAITGGNVSILVYRQDISNNNDTAYYFLSELNLDSDGNTADNVSNVIVTKDGSGNYTIEDIAPTILNTTRTVTSDAGETSTSLLASTGVPNIVNIVSYNGRLWGNNQQSELEYSFKKRSGTQFAFSEGLYKYNIAGGVGGITAIKVLGNTMIVFKKYSIYAVTGGNFEDNIENLTGGNYDITHEEIPTNNVGAISSNSILVTAKGLYFASEKGLYFLDRGYKVSYLGGKIEDLIPVNIDEDTPASVTTHTTTGISAEVSTRLTTLNALSARILALSNDNRVIRWMLYSLELNEEDKTITLRTQIDSTGDRFTTNTSFKKYRYNESGELTLLNTATLEPEVNTNALFSAYSTRLSPTSLGVFTLNNNYFSTSANGFAFYKRQITAGTNKRLILFVKKIDSSLFGNYYSFSLDGVGVKRGRITVVGNTAYAIGGTYTNSSGVNTFANKVRIVKTDERVARASLASDIKVGVTKNLNLNIQLHSTIYKDEYIYIVGGFSDIRGVIASNIIYRYNINNNRVEEYITNVPALGTRPLVNIIDNRLIVESAGYHLDINLETLNITSSSRIENSTNGLVGAYKDYTATVLFDTNGERSLGLYRSASSIVTPSIVSSYVSTTERELEFYLSNNAVLIFNTEFEKWSSDVATYIPVTRFLNRGLTEDNNVVDLVEANGIFSIKSAKISPYKSGDSFTLDSIELQGDLSGTRVSVDYEGGAPSHHKDISTSTDLVRIGSGYKCRNFNVTIRDAEVIQEIQSNGISLQGIISAGSHFSLILQNDRTIKALGSNVYGQLGNGESNQNSNSTPVNVIGIDNAIAVSTGDSHSLALLSDGTIKSWGDNYYGQLGDSTKLNRTTPINVIGIDNAIAVSTGSLHSLALLSDGTIKSWGYNTAGQLGDGANIDRTTPVNVIGINNAIAISAGRLHSLALLSDGTIKSWGDNYYGQLGDGTQLSKYSPVNVIGIDNAIAISASRYHVLALLSDGTIKSWGENIDGQLGDGTNIDRTTPVNVVGIDNAIAVSTGGYHTLALLSDGTIKSWGDNSAGQLGDGTDIDRITPVNVIGVNNAIAISTGRFHTIYLLEDGAILGNGSNFRGVLGSSVINGTMTQTPELVVGTGKANTGVHRPPPPISSVNVKGMKLNIRRSKKRFSEKE